MCRILRAIQEHGGTVVAPELEIEGAQQVEIDKQLKYLYEEGYVESGTTSVTNIPKAISPGPEVRQGIEELCTDPVADFKAWLWERLKAGTGKAIEQGVAFGLGVLVGMLLHWIYTLVT